MRTLNQIERYESHEPGLKLRKARDILQTAVVKGSFGRLQARANSHNSKHAFVVKYDEICTKYSQLTIFSAVLYVASVFFPNCSKQPMQVLIWSRGARCVRIPLLFPFWYLCGKAALSWYGAQYYCSPSSFLSAFAILRASFSYPGLPNVSEMVWT